LSAALTEAAALEVLREYSERAADAGDPAGAAWAAGELADRSRTPSDQQYWLGVSASFSSRAGETDEARAAFERLRRSSEPGSDLYELSLRRLHEMTVDTAPGEADELFREYRDLYGERGGAVEMGVRSAEAWLNRGDLPRARDVLESLAPSDARETAIHEASLGRLELLDGRLDAARTALEVAASNPAGDPAARLNALEHLALLDAADRSDVRVVVRLLSEIRGSASPAGLVDSLRAWAAAATPGGDLLAAFAARELEASRRREEAATLRRELISGWPGSAVAPQAMLELARFSRREDPGGAREWLERLIVDYPESALAPVARRLLSEIDAGSADG